MLKPLNWTEITNTCPEFSPNAWDVILAIIAIIGLVLSVIVFVRFHKQRKEGSSFLAILATCDIVMCLMYLWRYSATSLIMGFQSDTLAQLHIALRVQEEYMIKLYEPLMTFVMLFIIIERLLWTCTSRTRYTWRLFTLKMPKFMLLVFTSVFLIVMAIFLPVYDKPFSKIPFCDIVFPRLVVDDSVFQFCQKLLFSTLVLASILTLLIAAFTIFRLHFFGIGDGSAGQEEMNLESQAEEKAKPTPEVIKSSIICLLVVYIMFLVRAIAYYTFIENMTSDFYTLNLSSRIVTLWRYDFMNVLFAVSRFIAYYILCKNNMVIEYPPNILAQ